jgi:CheY-like chemotaxis protein
MTKPLLAGMHVLIVEDDAVIATAMAENFAHAGAIVVGPATTVQAGLAALDHSPRIDAAVVDLNLHGEIAYPVADRLIERGIPFVFATGFGTSDIPTRYAAIGHCAKPVDPHTLAEAFSWLSRGAE